ncbi:MAG: GNAT family N-acetyltransferase [Chloroflexi bacterium]|nr:GNAT family N-acetyltransferase [Chloroflexota bacterium]
MTDSFHIRLCEPRDLDAVYDVCLKTGDAGRDATHLYSDPKALGHIFVGPYLQHEAELAFVLEDGLGVCGYVLGALDSARFYEVCLNQWLPALRRAHPCPAGEPSQWTPTEKAYYEYYHPDIYYPESFHAYPSHLHIDLLPRAQGRGQGQRMMAVLLDRLKSLGSPGAHLGMAASNARAEHFYRKLGFHELARVGPPDCGTLYLAKRLGA